MSEQIPNDIKDIISELEWLSSNIVSNALMISSIGVIELEASKSIAIQLNLDVTNEELHESYDRWIKYYSNTQDEKTKESIKEYICVFERFFNGYSFESDYCAAIKKARVLNDYSVTCLRNWVNQNNFDLRINIIFNDHKSNSGYCYIATAVYGSYDCPQVWRFRRYRDEYLSKKVFGKVFIKTYYAVSPTIIKHFGKTEWFNSFFKKCLDKFYLKLSEKGYEDTPYQDK